MRLLANGGVAHLPPPAPDMWREIQDVHLQACQQKGFKHRVCKHIVESQSFAQAGIVSPEEKICRDLHLARTGRGRIHELRFAR
jgi:hypothetical protein